MAKPAPKARASKPAPAPRNPITNNNRVETKPRGRPKETSEPRRAYNFRLEESVADLFDKLAEQHRKDTNGSKHGAAKRYLVHMIKRNK